MSGLISSLKQQMEDMQKVKERAEKVAKDALAESKSLREPLEYAIIDNKELKRQMSNYDRDKAALAVSLLLFVYSNKLITLSCNWLLDGGGWRPGFATVAFYRIKSYCSGLLL